MEIGNMARYGIGAVAGAVGTLGLLMGGCVDGNGIGPTTAAVGDTLCVSGQTFLQNAEDPTSPDLIAAAKVACDLWASLPRTEGDVAGNAYTEQQVALTQFQPLPASAVGAAEFNAEYERQRAEAF